MALNDQYLNDDLGSLFIQVDGVGPQDLSWLGCHDLGDVSKPLGDVERQYCPDPAARGRWIVSSRLQGPEGEVTFDMELAIGRLADALELAVAKKCAIPVYDVFYACGGRTTFSPFWRVLVIPDALATSMSVNSPSSRHADGSIPTQITETFSFSAQDLFWAYELGYARKTIVEVENLLDIANCSSPSCAGVCGGAVESCDVMVASATAGAAAPPEIYRTTDGGQTWVAMAFQPFLATEDASSIVCFELDDGTVRVLTSIGVTTVATPAFVAYTDDIGATAWVQSQVGTVDTEFFPWNGCLFALNGRNVWACTDTGGGLAGNVYKSSDFGVTWTLMLGGTGDALNCVRFVNDRVGMVVGDQNEIWLTVNGGADWVTVTGPAAQAAVDCKTCVIFSSMRFYVGYSDGEIWMTADGGTTWTMCPSPIIAGYTLTACNDMGAINENVIWAAYCFNVAADEYGVMARTITGGEQWETWVANTACTAGVGINAVAACDVNHAFGVGCVETTAWVMEVAAA